MKTLPRQVAALQHGKPRSVGWRRRLLGAAACQLCMAHTGASGVSQSATSCQHSCIRWEKRSDPCMCLLTHPHAHSRRVADLHFHACHLSTHPLHWARGSCLALGRRLRERRKVDGQATVQCLLQAWHSSRCSRQPSLRCMLRVTSHGGGGSGTAGAAAAAAAGPVTCSRLALKGSYRNGPLPWRPVSAPRPGRRSPTLKCTGRCGSGGGRGARKKSSGGGPGPGRALQRVGREGSRAEFERYWRCARETA